MCFKVFLTSLTTIVTFEVNSIMTDNKFLEVINKLNFVDKTLLIKEILKHKILIINCPSGFGKSTNLDMTGLFLSNQHKKSEIASFFQTTKIFNEKNIVENHLGKYPVIQNNILVDGNIGFDSILTSFKVSLHQAFMDHIYLLHSEKIEVETREQVMEYSDLRKTKQMSCQGIIEGVTLLSELLYKHHSKPVVMLFDNFGLGVAENICKRTDVSSLLDFYTSILQTTINNSRVISHAVMSGETWLYGLKGTPLTVVDNVGFLQSSEFSPFYGFTYSEADHIMSTFKVQEDKKKEVYKWYGGYLSFDGKLQILNPTSLLKFLQHNSIEMYWASSRLGSNLIEFMFKELSFKSNFSNLVMNSSNTVRIDLQKDMHLICLENLKNKISQIPEHCGNFFYRILLETGYLTFSGNECNDKKRVTLTMPNEEIRSYFKNYLSKFCIIQWQNNISPNLQDVLFTI